MYVVISHSLLFSLHPATDPETASWRCKMELTRVPSCPPTGFYCMPSEGVELSKPEHLLSDDEIIRTATLFVKSGVTKIRLTGGEPTVRKGIVEIVGT